MDVRGCQMLQMIKTESLFDSQSWNIKNSVQDGVWDGH